MRLIAAIATLLLSFAAGAHAPRESVGALPFGEPTRIERQAEPPSPANAPLAKSPAQQKTTHRARTRFLYLDPARDVALTHCRVLGNRWILQECASGDVDPTVYVDPDGRIAILKDRLPGIEAFGRHAAEAATYANEQFDSAPWYMKPSLAATYALGGVGYLGSGVAGGVVSGANVIANAAVLATEMGGNQLGTTTIAAGLAGEARGEIEATVDAVGPVIQAFGADTWGATKAAGQAGVAAVDQMITAAQSGDAKAQFDILAIVKDGAQNVGAGIMARMAKPGGPPVVSRIEEGSDGSAQLRTAELTYRHNLKPDKETDIEELQRQIRGHESALNKIIDSIGMAGLKKRILDYKNDPKIEREGRRFAASLPSAGDGRVHLHEPDMATGALPTDVAGTGSARENFIIGGQARRVANDILAMPDDINCIECKLELRKRNE